MKKGKNSIKALKKWKNAISVGGISPHNDPTKILLVSH